MEDLVTISANLGTKEDPLIVRMGITTQAYSLMKEMLENEPKLLKLRLNEIHHPYINTSVCSIFFRRKELRIGCSSSKSTSLPKTSSSEYLKSK